MSFVIIDSKEFSQITERLHANKLTKDDQRLIELLLVRASKVAEQNVATGRFNVDFLPVGMDLVK